MGRLKIAIDIKGFDLARLSVELSLPGAAQNTDKKPALTMTLEELQIFLKALSDSNDIEIISPHSGNSGQAQGRRVRTKNPIMELKARYQQIVGYGLRQRH